MPYFLVGTGLFIAFLAGLRRIEDASSETGDVTTGVTAKALR